MSEYLQENQGCVTREDLWPDVDLHPAQETFSDWDHAVAQIFLLSIPLEFAHQQNIGRSVRDIKEAVEQLYPWELHALGNLVAHEEEVDIPLAVLGSDPAREQARAAKALGKVAEAEAYEQAVQFLYSVTTKEYVEPDPYQVDLRYKRVGSALQRTITALFAYNDAHQQYSAAAPFTFALENMSPNELIRAASLADGLDFRIKESVILSALVTARRQQREAVRAGLIEDAQHYESVALLLEEGQADIFS